jgi:hypothetical protein
MRGIASAFWLESVVDVVKDFPDARGNRVEATDKRRKDVLDQLVLCDLPRLLVTTSCIILNNVFDGWSPTKQIPFAAY